MQEIKIKLGKWLVKKGIKLANIEPLDFYLLFRRDIDDEKDIRSKKHFGKFWGIYKFGMGSLSEHIKSIDPECITFIKNN